MTSILHIRNEGPQITETNFWHTEFNQKGIYYLSANAGAYRLLVPDRRVEDVGQMRTAREVILTKGWHRAYRREMVEVMFDDHSDEPFTLWLCAEATDNRVADQNSSGIPFCVYVNGCVLAASFKSFWRRADLPCMLPLK